MAADVNPATAAFCASVGRLRRERNWSQETLARKAGISPSMLSLIELGKSVPSLGRAIALATALGTSLDEMCGLTCASNAGQENREGS